MTEPTLDKTWVHIGLIIDRSGSMQDMDSNELAGSATQLIDEQRKTEGVTKVTATVANFDDEFNIIKRNENAEELTITSEDIKPRGMTALYTSLARLIRIIGEDLSDMTQTRPGTVVVIMLTDGDQTCHRLRNREDADGPYEGKEGHLELCKLVRQQEDTYKWKFFMLGTNLDSLEAGPKMGFTPETCMNYTCSTDGATAAIRSTSGAVRRYQELSSADTPELFGGYTQEEREDSLN